MPLTAKQKDFVQYYEDIASETRHDGKASYMKAHPKCSPKTAEANSSRMLRLTKIKQAIVEYGAEIALKADVKREEIIQALRQLAGLDELAEGVVKPNNGERIRSLELLGKTLVMFADKVVQEQDEQQALSAATARLRDEMVEAYRQNRDRRTA